jgi:hypothetical protein
MRPKPILAVTEAAGGLVTAVFEPRPDGSLRWVGTAPATPPTADRPLRACRYALPASAVWYRTLRVPAAAGRGRDRIIAFEAGRAFPFAGDALIWDSLPSLASGNEAAQLLVGLRHAEVEAYLAGLRMEGLRPSRLEPAAAALYRSFRYLHPAERRPGLLVDLAGATAQVLVVDGPRWTARTVAEVASSGGPSRWDRIHLEIARLTAGLGAAHSPVWGVVAGEPEATSVAAGALTLRLGIPVVPFDVWPAVQKPGETGRTPTDRQGAVLPILLGLALPPGPGEKTLVLLPRELLAQENRRRRRPALVAASTAVALSFSALAWRAGERAVDATERKDRLRRELPVLQEAHRAKTVNAAWERTQRERLARAQILHEARGVWPRFLTDLQQAMDAAGDAWVDRLEPRTLTDEAGGPWVSVHGRLLDRGTPTGGTSEEARRSVKAMLSTLGAAPSIRQLVPERFSPDEPGILRFELRARLAWSAAEGSEP